MTTHTIPEELFLLLTDDAGRQNSTSHRRQSIAAAAVAELALREKIVFSQQRTPRIQVRAAQPTGRAVLDQALAALTELDGKSIASAVAHRSMDLTEVIGEGFAAEGVVQRKDGWFATSWPTRDDTLETALRARLGAAIADPAVASLQDGILLELLRSRHRPPDPQGRSARPRPARAGPADQGAGHRPPGREGRQEDHG